MAVQCERVAASDLLDDIEDLGPLAGRRGVRLVVERGPARAVVADRAKVAQVFSNIIGKAQRSPCMRAAALVS